MAEFRNAFSSSESTAATIAIPGDGATGEHTLTVYAVEDAVADGTTIPPTFHQAAAGTATVKVKPIGSSAFETLYQDDGTTAVSIDFTAAAPASVQFKGSYAGIQVTPSSLDADCVVYAGLATDKRS